MHPCKTGDQPYSDPSPNGQPAMPPLPRPTPLHLSITPMKQIKIEPDFSTSTPLPPEILSTSTPLPPEILATMKPHPPPPSFSPPSSTCSPSPPLAKPVKPVLPTTTMPALPTVPVPLRMHTKEETEAAHDLLELSRSLPPISGQAANLQTAPPTPPSPPDDNHYTLIYITSPTPFHNEASGGGGNHYHGHNTEYPLTPPEQSTDSNMFTASRIGSPSMQSSPSQMLSDFEDDEMEFAASDLTLSIIDGRTKKSKHGGMQGCYEKDTKSKYTCSECGKNYATSSNLSRHKQTHRSLDSGSAKKCNICGKMYVSMPALSMHILTHNLNHKCHVCGKAFSRPWLLQGHLRSHTGQKPYLCTVCKKCFADRSNLRAHMQTHSPAKNFQCSKCKKTFALKSYLNKHYESACVRSDGSISPSSLHGFSMSS